MKGYVHEGVIVLSGGESLPEGTEVEILPISLHAADQEFYSLRGTVLYGPDPEDAGLPEVDWEALQ